MNEELEKFARKLTGMTIEELKENQIKELKRDCLKRKITYIAVLIIFPMMLLIIAMFAIIEKLCH